MSRPLPPTLGDIMPKTSPIAIYEGHTTVDQCIRKLMDRWHGADLLEIATDVASAMYMDDDKEEIDEGLETMIQAPSTDDLVPEDLLDADTILAAVRKAERDALACGDEPRQLAAAGVRCCLRAGNIHQVADALIENMQRADEERD